MGSRPGVQLRAERRTAELRRAIGQDLLASRMDQGISQQRLADAIGLDRGHIARVEAGVAAASLDVLQRIATGLGGDLSLRFFPGTGSALRDRHQAAIVETLVARRAAGWRPALEVAVYRPARGVIDLVLARSDTGTVVAVEVHSQLRRLEQLIRWANLKRDSLPSSDWWRISGGTTEAVSAMLVLRATEANRRIVAEHAATFGAAYPAASADAFDSLTREAPWPGAALLWAEISRGVVTLREHPPRGVSVGSR
jgi:transcriptional regulator with XRE-family HTH domain